MADNKSNKLQSEILPDPMGNPDPVRNETIMNKVQSWILPNPVWDVALSDAGHILAASGSTAIYIEGSVRQHTLPAGKEIWAVALSPDGQHLAIGSDDRYARLHEASGKKLWEFKTGEHVIGVAISANNLGMALASRDRSCYLFSTLSNIPLWSYQGLQAFLRVAINRDGTYVAAGTYGGEVYLFNKWGHVLWHDRARRHGDIWGIAMDEVDQHLVVASEKDKRIYLYTLDGTLRWSKSLDMPARGVAITSDGQYIAAIGINGTLFYYRQDGVQLLQYSVGRECCSLAMNSDGRYIVIGCYDGHVILLENTTPYTARINRLPDQSASWMAARIVRAAYMFDQHRGICAWFDMFDRALRCKHLDFCQALLTEIHEHDYPVTPYEKQGIYSREGAFLLERGLLLQQQGNIEYAKQSYQEGLRCYQKAGDVVGQGLAKLLLDADEELNSKQCITNWIGNGEEYLALRMKDIPPSDIKQRLAIIQVARECGWVQILRSAVIDEEIFSDLHVRKETPIVRAVAMAAFERRTSEVDLELIQKALQDESWVVRWRAAALARSVYKRLSYKDGEHLKLTIEAVLRQELVEEVSTELTAALGEINEK